MMIVKPNGGLGNRMRVIHSALVIAGSKKNKLLKILWKKDWGLNAGFFDLFYHIPNTIIIHKKWRMGLDFYFSKKIKGYAYFDDISVKHHQYDMEYWAQIPENSLLNTCMDFVPLDLSSNYNKLFKPKADIQNRIDNISSMFDNNTIGVQIRRTDNQPAIKNSPVEDFVHFMNNEISKDPQSNFFLATDDKEIEVYLSNLFPGKIMVQEGKDLSRNSLRGIKDALVDMYALSATKYILGSYKSSFGEVASYIGQIPFITVRR